MTNDTLLAPIARTALFDGLAPAALERIARVAERIVFQQGEVIQHDGDISDAAILIVSGKALIVDAPEDKTGEAIAAGSLIGELAMIMETRATSTIVARSSVRALRIPRHEMRAVLEADLAIAHHLIEKITDRLNRMAQEMRRVDALVEAAVEKLPAPIATWVDRPAASPPTHPLH